MNSPIIIEKTLNAKRSDVWAALTDNKKMKEWYFTLDEFKPEPGFKFSFPGGPEGRTYIHHCEVTDAVPEKKLTYSWRYEGYPGISYVTFELFGEENKTRLKLTHSGLESFPADNPDFAARNFEAGWKQIIGENLPKYLGE